MKFNRIFFTSLFNFPFILVVIIDKLLNIVCFSPHLDIILKTSFTLPNQNFVLSGTIHNTTAIFESGLNFEWFLILETAKEFILLVLLSRKRNAQKNAKVMEVDDLAKLPRLNEVRESYLSLKFEILGLLSIRIKSYTPYGCKIIKAWNYGVMAFYLMG